MNQGMGELCIPILQLKALYYILIFNIIILLNNNNIKV